MATYGIREFKAHLSEILRDLEAGDEVIITRHGKPCARLTAAPEPDDGKLPLSSLRDKSPTCRMSRTKSSSRQTKIWEPRMPPELDDEAADVAE